MRNPSKNTVKWIMRHAKRNQAEGFYFSNQIRLQIPRFEALNAYFLFNSVGARLYIMSKGKICNRGLNGANKYCRR